MTAASDTALGRLEAVDLRQVWPREDDGFTPWLADEGNIQLLGDAIGVELEVEGIEQGVGPFRADILCRDRNTGQQVLIENQLERTDHTHLGQLLTYAAGRDAVTVVWIARRFTDEHRAALDWLNEITGNKIGFFGIEIELWRIGASAPAPKFNIVSQPNNWTKSSGGPSGRPPTDREKFLIEYWHALWEASGEILERCGYQQPSSHYFTGREVGRVGFRLYLLASTSDKSISVQLEIDTQDTKADYAALHNDKEAIEHAIGDTLLWEERPDKKRSRITLLRRDCDPKDRGLWQKQHAWLVDKQELLHSVFVKQIEGP